MALKDPLANLVLRGSEASLELLESKDCLVLPAPMDLLGLWAPLVYLV